MAKQRRTRVKVIYFLQTAAATPEEQKEIDELEDANKIVVLRNGSVVSDTDSIEDFDELAGDIPHRYAEAKNAKDAEPKKATRNRPKVDGEKPAAPGGTEWAPNS